MATCELKHLYRKLFVTDHALPLDVCAHARRAVRTQHRDDDVLRNPTPGARCCRVDVALRLAWPLALPQAEQSCRSKDCQTAVHKKSDFGYEQGIHLGL